MSFAYVWGDFRRYGASGGGKINDQAAVAAATGIGGYALAYNGTYLCNSKVQITRNLTLLGENLQSTIIKGGTPLSDYLLEIGSSTGSHGNLGLIERVQLTAAGTNCRGLLHMMGGGAGNPPSFWTLRNILFQNATCPGLVIEEIWDSHFEYLIFLNCTGRGSSPARAASLIIKGNLQNSNNLYFKGLTFEGALCGAIYTTGQAAPIWITQGKIDNGFADGQLAPAITIAGAYGNDLLCDEVHLDQFTVTGILKQYAISTFGSLLLGDVDIEGGSAENAAILDRRAWFQLQPLSYSGIAAAAIGPKLPLLDLGRAHFTRALTSSNTQTLAAVQSKIWPIRYVQNLAVSSSTASGSTTTVGTNLAASANDVYNGLYLVHNPTGTQAAGEAGARRKILQSFANGNLVVRGGWELIADSDWSIEYCGGHYTPIRGVDTCRLDERMTLFAILQTRATISGTPTYKPSTSRAAPGMTTFTISASGFPASTDATGYYLVDEITGAAFLIGYGIDSSHVIGVMYDRTAAIDASHSFAIHAGYLAGIREVGNSWEWYFAGKRHTVLKRSAVAAGFDVANMPLWAFTAQGDP